MNTYRVYTKRAVIEIWAEEVVVIGNSHYEPLKIRFKTKGCVIAEFYTNQIDGWQQIAGSFNNKG